MPKVMRMARGASIFAVVVAALALGACANNKDLAGQGLAGSAVPGSQQDFVVNVGDRVFFESDSTETPTALDSTGPAEPAWVGDWVMEFPC